VLHLFIYLFTITYITIPIYFQSATLID